MSVTLIGIFKLVDKNKENVVLPHSHPTKPDKKRRP
jgi:hypothetical protein